MSEYKKHTPESVDLSILDRITEDEITAWMVAKAQSMKSDTFPISNLELELWPRKYWQEEYTDTRFSFYVAGEHGYGETIADAARAVREIIEGNPRSKAAEKRREAAAAVKEAEKLEALAAALG